LNGRLFDAPPNWFTGSCSSFAPDWAQLFGSSSNTLSIGTGIPNMDHAEYRVTSEHTEEIAGRTARAFEVEWISGYMNPGDRSYFWQFEPVQVFNVFDVAVYSGRGEEYARAKEAADAIARSMRIT
jgi:hypothetical protein